MPDFFQDSMSLKGLFVVFASPTPDARKPFIELLGSQRVSKHRIEDVLVYPQNDFNFIVELEPHSLDALSKAPT